MLFMTSWWGRLSCFMFSIFFLFLPEGSFPYCSQCMLSDADTLHESLLV